MSGDTTSARPGATRAGAWKHSDLPPPVGSTVTESRPSRIALHRFALQRPEGRVPPVARDDVLELRGVGQFVLSPRILNSGGELMSAVLERFLRYVQYDTQADESSQTYPSTDKQLVLLRDLAGELKSLGLSDAAMDAHGYVTATIPATSTRNTPTIGFIAHVDTSPEVSGANVKPIVHRNYDGRDLVLLRRSDGDPAPVRMRSARRSTRRRHHHGVGNDAARRGQQGGRRGDRHGRGAPDEASRDSPRADPDRLLRRTRRSAAAR